MNKHSFVVGSLLLAVPVMLIAREPKLQNPCKDLSTDLDNQVNSLHKRQDNELAQCRKTSGKNAAACRDLKNQQQIELQQIRDQRQSELGRCNPRLNSSSVRTGGTASVFVELKQQLFVRIELQPSGAISSRAIAFERRSSATVNISVSQPRAGLTACSFCFRSVVLYFSRAERSHPGAKTARA